MSLKPSKILVTGASGYLGGHTVSHLLQTGHHVLAAGRSQSTCNRMTSLHSSSHTSTFSTIVIPDITLPNAFDEAVSSVDGIIHLASPFTYTVEDVERDLLLPAVNGTLELLKSAQRSQSVKHVVLTSSFAAIADFTKGLRPGHTYDEMQWNPITWEEAKNSRGGLAYAGSKKLAEARAWEFVETHKGKVRFGLTTICPVMICGLPLPGSTAIGRLGQSLGEIWGLIDGSKKAPPETGMPVFVDVRDVALAHERALTKGWGKEGEDGGRHLVCGGGFTMDGVCGLVRERMPGMRERVPASAGMELEHYAVDVGRARRELGMEFRGTEECFLETVEALLELDGS